MPAPTLLDAFVVSIGWDTKKWTAGEKEIETGQKRVSEASRKSANDMEASGKKAAASFRTVRNEVLGLFLAIQGSSSIAGFIKDVISSNSQLGYFSDNIGVAIGKIAGLRGALETVGGSGKDADAGLQSLENIFRNRVVRGDISKDAELQGLGLTYNDLQDKQAALLKLSAASQRMGAQSFFNRASNLGLPPSLIYLLEKGPTQFRELWEQQEKLAHVTDADVKAAQEFDKTFATLKNTIKGDLNPAITALLNLMNGFKGSIGDGGQVDPLFGLFITAIIGIGKAAEYSAKGVLAIANAIRELRGLDPVSYDDVINGQAGQIELTDGAKTILKNGRAGGSAPAGVSNLYNVLAAKYGKERADGIWAGIGAESSWNPNNVNPTSGAYGLGQWLGPRKKALFAKYGRNPSAAQQIDFLMSELEGGDPGGRSVLGATSREGALRAYVYNFMRPSARGAAGDMSRGMATLGMRAPVRSTGGSASSVSIGTMIVNTPDANSFAKKDLPNSLAKRGIVVQGGSGMSQ